MSRSSSSRNQRKRRKREYDRYLQSEAWKELRRAVLDRDGDACVRCGSSLPPLHVHHKTYKNFGHEQLGELETLCLDCHDVEHGGRVKNRSKNVVVVEPALSYAQRDGLAGYLDQKQNRDLIERMRKAAIPMSKGARISSTDMAYLVDAHPTHVGSRMRRLGLFKKRKGLWVKSVEPPKKRGGSH